MTTLGIVEHGLCGGVAHRQLQGWNKERIVTQQQPICFIMLCDQLKGCSQCANVTLWQKL